MTDAVEGRKGGFSFLIPSPLKEKEVKEEREGERKLSLFKKWRNERNVEVVLFLSLSFFSLLLICYFSLRIFLSSFSFEVERICCHNINSVQ